MRCRTLITLGAAGAMLAWLVLGGVRLRGVVRIERRTFFDPTGSDGVVASTALEVVETPFQLGYTKCEWGFSVFDLF